jgi:hypothetical protein
VCFLTALHHTPRVKYSDNYTIVFFALCIFDLNAGMMPNRELEHFHFANFPFDKQLIYLEDLVNGKETFSLKAQGQSTFEFPNLGVCKDHLNYPVSE